MEQLNDQLCRRYEELIEKLKLKFGEQELIPAIVKDAAGRVLMVAYMNREALVRTLASGETWFWSRSRCKFWHKGESSGHVQKVKNIYFDCDRDTLLIEVEQVGAACHEGFYSCFHYLIDEVAADGFRVVGEKLFSPEQVYGRGSDNSTDGGNNDRVQPVAAGGNSKAPIGPEVLSELVEVISQRLRERPAGSYTAKIQERGIDYALKKIGEETAEFITAIKNGEPGAIAAEAADVIYHLLVALLLGQVSPASVWAELAARRSRSTR